MNLDVFVLHFVQLAKWQFLECISWRQLITVAGGIHLSELEYLQVKV